MRTLVAFSLLSLSVVACSRVTEPDPIDTKLEAKPLGGSSGGPVNLANVTELQKIDLVVGNGPEVKKGQRAKVHYTGTLVDGTKFDSSKDRNSPFTVTLGAGEVIKGWDEGIPGMKVGGKRKLIIPYPMAYGEAGRPPTIPPKATLIFEVELLEIVG